MSNSFGKYNILRLLLWGTKGEKLFLKLRGQQSSEESARRMRRIERGGFCQSYGVVPVHTVVNVVVPVVFSLAASEVGMPHISLAVWGASILLASASSLLPIKPHAVKKSAGVSSYVRKRQFKVSAASLLAGVMVSTAISAANNNSQTSAKNDVRTGVSVRLKETPPTTLPALPDGRRISVQIADKALP